MATGVRTPDESPLTIDDIKLAGKYFQHVQHREFWITTLSLFAKYYLIDRVHPNADRYWKRILLETPASLWWWRPLLAVDSIFTCVPGLKWLAWNVVMSGTRGG